MAADNYLYASAFPSGMSVYSMKPSTLPDSTESLQFLVPAHPDSPAFPSPVLAYSDLTVSFRKIPTAYPTKSTIRLGSHLKSSQVFLAALAYSAKSSPALPATHASSSKDPTSVPVSTPTTQSVAPTPASAH
jgi:hypothetical protein